MNLDLSNANDLFFLGCALILYGLCFGIAGILMKRKDEDDRR